MAIRLPIRINAPVTVKVTDPLTDPVAALIVVLPGATPVAKAGGVDRGRRGSR